MARQFSPPEDQTVPVSISAARMWAEQNNCFGTRGGWIWWPDGRRSLCQGWNLLALFLGYAAFKTGKQVRLLTPSEVWMNRLNISAYGRDTRRTNVGF